MLIWNLHQNKPMFSNGPLFDTLCFLDTSFFSFNTLDWRCYLGRISPLHWSILLPPDLFRCINGFVEFHILYSFPQSPWYQRSLFPFSPLLSTLSHSQIESRTSLFWLSLSWVRLYMIDISSLLQSMSPGTQEYVSFSRINPEKKQLAVIYTTIIHSLLGEQSRLCCG